MSSSSKSADGFDGSRTAGETHTPGPWTIEYYGSVGDDNLIIHSSPDNRVCFMATPGRDYDRPGIVANARLIAAAPELLEALQYMMSMVDERGLVLASEHEGYGIALARAAIAKATREPDTRGDSESQSSGAP